MLVRKAGLIRPTFSISFGNIWVLTESRIPLKPELVGVRIVALSISSHE